MSMPMRMMAYTHRPDLDGSKISGKVLKRTWRFALPYRTRLILHLVAILAASGVAILPPLIAKHVIDEAIPHRDFALVNELFVAGIVIAALNTALGLINRWFSATIGEGLIFDLRVRLYEHVQKMPIGFFTRTQTGALLSRLNNDVVGAQATITSATNVTSDIVSLIITLVAMFALSWQVTLFALLVVPVFIFIDRRLSKRLAELTRRRLETNAEMNATMQERFNVSGALLVKLFGRPKDELAIFSRRAIDVRDAGVKSAFIGRLYFTMFAITGAIGVAVVYWLGARSVINGGLTIGTLTALAAYVARLYEPMTGIASARVDLLSALVSFERCFEVLDAPITIDEPVDPIPLQAPQGSISFDNVWFRYPAPASVSIASLEVVTHDPQLDHQPSNWILQDVSFTAEKGETVALVGPSGAGKTTLSSLIPRIYDVDEGTVSFDGIDVRSLGLQQLHDAIGVVSQDTHLFHDTVEANLRYAYPTATDNELIVACTAARIHHVIAALPNGYNTVVGERGHRLSGGEKQRLAIARVLLKQPAVVLLDEATAHLDSETELLVQQALSEALSGRTAIVIAHRLSTIRSADKIIVLDQGRIVEQGTHVQLIASGGLYSELHDTQYTVE